MLDFAVWYWEGEYAFTRGSHIISQIGSDSYLVGNAEGIRVADDSSVQQERN